LASRKAEKERLRQERLARERELAAAARRRRMLGFYGLGGIAVAVAAIVVVFVVTGGTGNSSGGSAGTGPKPKLQTVSLKTLSGVHPAPSPGALGPEGIPLPHAPLLASNASASTGATVDGIQCNTNEQTIFHVHTHLTIFVNGHPRQLPYGIGIAPPRQVSQTSRGPFVQAGACFYWLHTHAADGIIHIESPIHRAYTLGNFFDIWRQPLGPDEVGPVKGKVTAFYDGKVYKGNPRNIPLGDHTRLQLDVGTPLIAPETISFAGSGL
jgi:hypothetical protein